ncbi:hypothetical protein GCK32_017184 [Trichostrongylus colubriformis]|uniref:Serine aminopeptidase S33 domain-containing protein n=1 Tax=Trichostrongylus colubriformis TaxID=6319 RepID=A0AAN8FEP8_TRICO
MDADWERGMELHSEGTPLRMRLGERLLYRNPGSPNVLWNISEWREDIEKRVDGDEWVVIASSAGCHAALNAAKNRPQNIKGLFLFCPGVSLSFNYVDAFFPDGSAALLKGKSLVHPASRGGYEALINHENLQHYLDTCVTKAKGAIDIRCPVTIVHGTRDEVMHVTTGNSQLRSSPKLTRAVALRRAMTASPINR